jgi:hypothetical protein
MNVIRDQMKIKKKNIYYWLTIALSIWMIFESTNIYAFSLFRGMLLTKKATNITNYGTYRAWSDGTFAATCEDYRNPTSSKFAYAGSTGDGIYRITLTNGSTVNAYCLMSQNNHGYVMLAGVPSNARGTPIINSIYSTTSPFISNQLQRYYKSSSPMTIVRYQSASCSGLGNGYSSEYTAVDTNGYWGRSYMILGYGPGYSLIYYESDGSANNYITWYSTDVFNYISYQSNANDGSFDLAQVSVVIMSGTFYSSCGSSNQLLMFAR